MKRSLKVADVSPPAYARSIEANQLDLPMTSDVVPPRPSTSKVVRTHAVLGTAPLKMLRVKEVCETTGLSRSTIYQLEADGSFPKRVAIGERAVAWVQSEVQDWLVARLAVRPADGGVVPKMPGRTRRA
jgi:prophage regulatory protein